MTPQSSSQVGNKSRVGGAGPVAGVDQLAELVDEFLQA